MVNEKFFKKWEGKKLADNGAWVSNEFKAFQRAFKAYMKEVASSMGATLSVCKGGHYDMYGFLEKNGKYVYFNYSSFGYRNVPNLYNRQSFYCRTAKSTTDYVGGNNNFVAVSECESTINRLFNAA